MANEAEKIVHDFCKAFESKNLEAIMGFFTDDAVYHNIPMKPVSGKAAIRARSNPSCRNRTTTRSPSKFFTPAPAATSCSTSASIHSTPTASMSSFPSPACSKSAAAKSPSGATTSTCKASPSRCRKQRKRASWPTKRKKSSAIFARRSSARTSTRSWATSRTTPCTTTCQWSRPRVRTRFARRSIRICRDRTISNSKSCIPRCNGNIVFNERIDMFDIGEKRIELPVAGMFEVRGGKITLWRDYFDLQSFTKQMS